jgi:hypothetical protein
VNLQVEIFLKSRVYCIIPIISRQNLNGFFPNISHQRMIYLNSFYRSKPRAINTPKIRN